MTAEFSVGETDHAAGQNEVSVSFADGVVVDGTIVGKDGSMTATLSDVTYDPDSATLTVAVATEPDEASDDFAPMALLGIDYSLRIEPDGRVDRVVVEHDAVESWRTTRSCA